MNVTIKAFGYPGTLIKEFKHWVVLLRPKQITLGSLVIAAKSEAKHLGELTGREWAEFADISAEMEELLGKTFEAEKFNYLALMMVDPNVHFHFVPRYSKPVEFKGEKYEDPDWPRKTELKPMEISPEVFENLKKILREKLK